METPPPISFARGAPSLDIVAVDELRAAAQRAFENDPGGTTAYGTSIGYVPLREWIAEYQQVAPEQVVVTNGSMQADAFLFRPARPARRPRDRRGAELRPHAARPARAGRGAHGDPARGGRRGRRGDRARVRGAARARSSRTSSPTSTTRAAPRSSLEKRRRLLDLAKTYDFIVFEDDPYVELRFEGETLPTMLSLDDARPRRLRLVVLEDRLPRHPRRLPRGPAGADRRRREDGDEHLHLAEHGVAVDRERVLPLRRARGLDRDGQERPPRAARRAVRGARARAARRVVHAPRGRLLPVGGPPGGRRRRAARGRRQGARRRVRARHRLPARRAARTACGSPTRA